MSGGLDSTVAAALAIRKYGVDQVASLHISYGQQTSSRELEAWLDVCSALRIPHSNRFHTTLHLERSFSELTKRNGDVRYDPTKRIPQTYVPFRNGVAASVAAHYADGLGADLVVIGVHEADSRYPDCNRQFVMSLSRAFSEGTAHKVQLWAPLIDYTKAEIVQVGVEIGAPLELTWSCYGDNRLACGECESCITRYRAFKKAGYIDPIRYRRVPE